MFGKYLAESMKGISAARTVEVQNLIKKNGGELVSAYILLGEYDVLLIVNFPSIDDMLKSSVALSKLFGISISTVPAVTAEHFDKMIT
jgi:uncharacterized protein with GYD domain